MRNQKLRIHIPLKERDALAGLLEVKPSPAMPRPGANPTGKRKQRIRRPRANPSGL